MAYGAEISFLKIWTELLLTHVNISYLGYPQKSKAPRIWSPYVWHDAYEERVGIQGFVQVRRPQALLAAISLIPQRGISRPPSALRPRPA